MKHTAASPHHTYDGSICPSFDFPVARFGGPLTSNYVRNLSAPKVNHGQITAALDVSGGNWPARLILGSSYQQFADANVVQPPGLIKEVWQPVFLVVAHNLVDPLDWGEQVVLIVPIFLLSLFDTREPRLVVALCHLISERPKPFRDITVREFITEWDRVTDRSGARE